MRAKGVIHLLAVVFVFGSATAHAFRDPPYVNPPNPVAGQPITFSIYGGVCDAIIAQAGFPIFIPDRATGDFLAWQADSPDPARTNHVVEP